MLTNQTPIKGTSLGPSNLFKSNVNQIEAERKVQEMCAYFGSFSNASDIYAHLKHNICIYLVM